MFDERLLARSLPRPAQDASARALDEIMHLAHSAEYQPAAERAAELLDAGCKDVRAFVAYALGVFAERGPASVPALFDAISGLLTSGDAGASPSALRTADTTLRFAFRIMRAHLDFDERRPEAARQAWTQHLDANSASSLPRACSELRRSVHQLIEEPLCDAELGAVRTRLESYLSRNAADKPAPRRGGADVTERLSPAEPPVLIISAQSAPESKTETPPFARRASDHDEQAESLPISPALRQFMRKLEIFERLIMAGSLAKAAIVAQDVRNVIAAFDPMVYLPSLLAPHFRLLSTHVEQLSPYWEMGATPSWHALEQLYRVDLDSFAEE